MFSHIKISFKMNTIFCWNHLKRPFLKIEQMRRRKFERENNLANIILAKDQTAHTDLFEMNLIWCLSEIISKMDI